MKIFVDSKTLECRIKIVLKIRSFLVLDVNAPAFDFIDPWPLLEVFGTLQRNALVGLLSFFLGHAHQAMEFASSLNSCVVIRCSPGQIDKCIIVETTRIGVAGIELQVKALPDPSINDDEGKRGKGS
ncbi:hypothetical protein HG530_008373 [Fusarium avenaceum]|nr:hypothetical protein HG530_008373 [Fusarium avenaceum]